MKIEGTMNPVFEVFDHWNSYKGQGYGKAKWKSHRLISSEIEDIIAYRLTPKNARLPKAIAKRFGHLTRGYTVDQLKAAIDNYAKVLLSPDYKWTYAWTLLFFLMRRHPHRRDEEQLWRWTEGNFHEDDYLRAEVKVSRARKPVASPPIEPLTLEEKREIARKEGLVK